MSNLHDWLDFSKALRDVRYRLWRLANIAISERYVQFQQWYNADKQEEEWRKKVGNPFATLELEGCKLGFWRAKGGVFTATIRKNGPDPHTVETFTEQFIEKLVSTLKG